MLEAVMMEDVKVEKKAKYDVGDKVVYLDVDKIERVGSINAIEWTEISDWNKESSPLYLVGTCPYLRDESKILGFNEDYLREV